MTWKQLYVIKSYIRGSLWLVPFFALMFYIVFVRAVEALNRWLVLSGRLDDTTSFMGLSAAGAQSMLETIITMNLSFMVFTFGSLLVAIQVAGGQYTPRIIATTLLRDNAIRITVGYFVFTMCFALRVQTRMDDEIVHQLNVFMAAQLGLISVVMFLFLIDHAARMLRPVSIVRRVGADGIAVIEGMYPNPTAPRSPDATSGEPAPGQRTDPAARTAQSGGFLRRLAKAVTGGYAKPAPLAHTHEQPRRRVPPKRIVTHVDKSGIVLALDLVGLAGHARRFNGIIEVVPQVGDFLAVGEPLFRLFDGADAIDDQTLRNAVALGSERTIEQDPTFAFRILVDIAIKALSAAINDPTTAVTSIDQIHRLLRLVGLRDLRDEEIRDETGALRLVFRTPNWEDFVHLSCIEIRHCGGGSVQIVRRMRSMLENLTYTLPPHRHAELRLQLELLDRTIKARYTFPEDLAIARIADPQGLGGSLGVQAVDGSPTADRGL